MVSGGTYRINTIEFPAPISTWELQAIAPKLNGLPVINSYALHVWEWPAGALEACYVELLIDLWQQQDASGQLDYLETDPHDADEATEDYGTAVYTDFIIKEVYPLRRGLPMYDNVRVVFEVYIGA